MTEVLPHAPHRFGRDAFRRKPISGRCALIRKPKAVLQSKKADSERRTEGDSNPYPPDATLALCPFELSAQTTKAQAEGGQGHAPLEGGKRFMIV